MAELKRLCSQVYTYVRVSMCVCLCVSYHRRRLEKTAAK